MFTVRAIWLAKILKLYVNEDLYGKLSQFWIEIYQVDTPYQSEYCIDNRCQMPKLEKSSHDGPGEDD